MGRAPCCDKANVKKGPWSPEEDSKLKEFIEKHGTTGNWIALPHKAGLKRCGKSCRLRWLNYLRPNIKHGEFSDEEDRIICNLFASIGSRWSVMASQLPGRTDNDIKNYWNTKLKKKLLGAAIPSQRKPQQSCLSSLQIAPSTKSHTGFQGISTSSNLLNNTSTILQGHGNLVSPLLHHPYQAKDSFLMFGGEQSCSSSDGSCNQISYGKEIDFEYGGGGGGGGGDQMGLESYLFNGFGDDHKLLFGGGIDKGNGFVGEAPLEYNFGEIKQVLNTNSGFNNCYVVDDAGAVRGSKSQGTVMYYY